MSIWKDLFFVPVRSDSDRPLLAASLVLEKPLVRPSASLVKPPSSGVARHHRQPCRPMTRLPYLALGLANEDVCHAQSPVVTGDIHLLEFIPHHHDEACHLSRHHSDGGVDDP